VLIRLHLQSAPQRVERGLRLGWLFVSLSLLLMAVYFLYPVVESFSERDGEMQHPSVARTAVVPPAGPVSGQAEPPKEQVRTLVQASIPPIPIRETAPAAPEGIRNRIEGMVPVEVTMRIGRDGSVVSAHAPAQYDSVRSYFAQQAVAAARQWRFRPAKVGQETVASQWTVRFRFYRSGVEWN
jgi:hypothetical protein